MKKLILIFGLILFANISYAQGFIKFYPPAGVTEITSNGTVITSTLPIRLPDGTAVVPSLAFTSDTDTGLRWLGTGAIGFNIDGTVRFRMYNGSFRMGSLQALGWSSNADPNMAVDDLILSRDAANTLALRNGGTAGTPVPQTFNVYNFCDGASCVTGYEKLGIYANSNQFYIVTAAAGTGTVRRININSGAAGLAIAGGTIEIYGNPQSGLTSGLYSLGTSAILWKELFLASSIQGSKSKALTDNVATAFTTMAMPQTAGSNYGSGKGIYTIFCKDAANQAVEHGSFDFACHNLAGTESCTIGTAGAPTVNIIHTDGTASFVAPVFTAAAGADLVTFSVQSDCTGVTPTTHTIEVRFDLPHPNTLAFP